MSVPNNSNSSSSTRRRPWIFAASGLVAACVGALFIPAVRAPLARKLGVGAADAPRCEPARGMRAAYQLHMHTQLKVLWELYAYETPITPAHHLQHISASKSHKGTFMRSSLVR